MSNTIHPVHIPFWYSQSSGENTTLKMINKKREELKAKNQEPSFPKTLTPAKAIAGGVGIFGVLLAAFGLLKDNRFGKILGLGATVLGAVGCVVGHFFIKDLAEKDKKPSIDKTEQIKDPIFDKAALDKEFEYRKYFKQQMLRQMLSMISDKNSFISELQQQRDIVAIDKDVFVIPDDAFGTYTDIGIIRGRSMSCVKDNLSAQQLIDTLITKYEQEYKRGISDEERIMLAFIGYIVSPGNIIFPHSTCNLAGDKSLGVISHELLERFWDTKTFSDNEREKIVMLTKTFDKLKSVYPVADLIKELINNFAPYTEEYNQGTFAHEFWASLAYSEHDDDSDFRQLKNKAIKLIEKDYPEAFTAWSLMKNEAKQQAEVFISRYHNYQFMDWDEVLR